MSRRTRSARARAHARRSGHRPGQPANQPTGQPPKQPTGQPPAHRPGRHELGQNFLVDRRVVADVIDRVAATRGPILEIGPGDGALTMPLARLGRPIRALEADARRAARLAERAPRGVRVEHADALAHRFDARPHVVVSNLPFHITTAMLRRLLAAPGWTDAVLIAQWEVARRRAGVGGATQLTAQAAPWFEFALAGRIPRQAYRPMPQVDGGLFTVHRRERPLVDAADRRTYEAMVARVFGSAGADLRRILPAARVLPPAAAKRWLRERSRAAGGLPHRSAELRERTLALPRDLSPADWADLWHAHRATG